MDAGALLDAALMDAGSDAGPSDAGPSDDGPSDSGPSDGGSMDAGSEANVDAGLDGSIDAGVDAGPPPEPAELRDITPFVDGCVAAPTDFGIYGAVTRYARYEVTNPEWSGAEGMPVQVFASTDASAGPRPVIFFSHAFGGTNFEAYDALIDFLVSHDFVVVYTPYDSALTVPNCTRYDILWAGMNAAIAELGGPLGMDLARVGFAGHSFGGGATPWLAHQGVVGEGWGTNGAFLFVLAPWYSFRMEAADFAEFPDHVRLLAMVYDEDDTNDHRIAIDEQYELWPHARSYQVLYSDTEGECTLSAGHSVPATRPGAPHDALDTWGTFRRFHALAECAFTDGAEACAVSLGGGADAQAMGNWLASGDAVTPANVMAAPVPTQPMSYYMFPQSAGRRYLCD